MFASSVARRLIEPNPENASHAELETAAKCARSSRESARMRAMVALIMGLGRPGVCHIFGIDERTLLRWIKAFNKRGIDGLLDKVKSGRPRKIPPERLAQCRNALEQPAAARGGHWTGVKFHGHLREELGIEIGYSTVIRFLHEQGFALKVPQPWSDRQDEAARQEFREKLRQLMGNANVEIWFGDECGVEGEPKPRRRWAKRGEKTRGIYNGEHLRMNVAGMVCPRTGQFYALGLRHLPGVPRRSKQRLGLRARTPSPRLGQRLVASPQEPSLGSIRTALSSAVLARPQSD